jgi:Protein of unknown function
MNGGAAALCFMGVGLLTALVAQQGTSAYHDGVRPLLPEYRTGEITGPELSRRAWSMSAGFIAWFALPFTLITRVATSHLLFLPPEILGLRHASRVLAATIGAACGAGVFGVVAAARAVYPHLPLSVAANLPVITAPVQHTLFLFPVAASYHQWGLRIAAGVSAVAMIIVTGASKLGRLPGGLSPNGLALLAGTAIIVVLAMRHRRENRSPLPRFLLDHVRSLRRAALLPLAAIGALCGALAQSRLLAGEPAAALLVGTGRMWDAAAVGVFSAVAFAPMVARSAATSGAYSTQGFPDWVLSAGMISGTPVVGAAAGAAVLSAEILAAPQTLALLHTFPELAELGSSMRQGMTEVLDLTVLVGSVLSANAMLPAFGAAIVVALFIWNETSQRRLMPVAVGPIGVLITALWTILAARGG